jgi:hypothetical protein
MAREQSYIGIGWREVGDLRKLAPTRDAFKAAVAQLLPDKLTFNPSIGVVHSLEIVIIANVPRFLSEQVILVALGSDRGISAGYIASFQLGDDESHHSLISHSEVCRYVQSGRRRKSLKRFPKSKHHRAARKRRLCFEWHARGSVFLFGRRVRILTL